MANKAYIIVHDGADVLVGIGGKSGRKKQERRGYHLPGGTIDSNETAEKAAIRELKEETGIDSKQLIVEHNNITIGVEGVTFVVARVDSVDALVEGFNQPNVTNSNDEPYKSLLSLQSKGSWEDENFNEAYCTDWFACGLYAAREIIAPQ